jgi:sugar-specific transcriptional regulator TrmB
MDTSILEELGLTKGEITAFVTLVELGPSRAGEVVDRSGLQSPVVHRAFHSLLRKGLITAVLEGKIHKYQAIDVSQLQDFLNEKRERLNQLIQELKKIKILGKEKTRAGVYYGVRGLKQLLAHIIDTRAEEMLSYGGSAKSIELLGDVFWRNFHRKRLDKKIKARLIFHTSLSSKGQELNKYENTQIRLTERTFEELVETFVCAEKVAILVYLDNPIGFLIEEPAASKSYSRFFELIWKAANPIS